MDAGILAEAVNQSREWAAYDYAWLVLVVLFVVAEMVNPSID